MSYERIQFNSPSETAYVLLAQWMVRMSRRLSSVLRSMFPKKALRTYVLLVRRVREGEIECEADRLRSYQATESTIFAVRSCS